MKVLPNQKEIRIYKTDNHLIVDSIVDNHWYEIKAPIDNEKLQKQAIEKVKDFIKTGVTNNAIRPNDSH